MTLEEYSKYLYHPKMNKYGLLGALKQEGDYVRIKKIYKAISQNSFVRSIFKANVKANDYKSIRSQKDAVFSGSLTGEIVWTLLCIEENAALIKDFLSLREKFEDSLLLARYEEARAILGLIEEKTGKSFWLIESKFLLEEYEHGVEANWKYLSEISKEITDPVALVSVEYLSKRAESKVSYFRFTNSFSSLVDDLISHRGLWEYFNFKLNPYSVNSYTQLAYIVNLENTSPLIDRYLTLKRVLYCLYCSVDLMNKDFIFDYIKRLNVLFPEDTELLQILGLWDSSFLKQLPVLNDLEELFEAYNRNNHQLVLDQSEKLIRKYPGYVELYELYVRSLIENDKSVERLRISPLIDQIIDTLFVFYSNEGEFESTWDLSLKLGLSFFSMMWARQYLNIVRTSVSVREGNRNFSQDFVVFSRMPNPRTLYFINAGDVKIYADEFRSIINAPITVDIIEGILLGNEEQIIQINELSDEKKNLYVVRAQMKARNFESAKNDIERILDLSDNLKVIVKEEYLVHLFRCYLQLEMLSEAVLLFVDNYLVNTRIVKRFNVIKLLNKLDSFPDESFKFIELPIFLKIVTNDSYKQYVGFDTYLSSVNKTKPTEFLEDLRDGDEKMIFFLREVCSIEVMHLSYHFEGTENIENERMRILNRLIVLDKKNEAVYIQELTELNQSASIRRAMREVNKGRISINVKQLRETEFQNIKEAFVRLKEIENYAKSRDIMGIDASNLIHDINTSELEEFDKNKVVYTSDPAFISFKVLFIEIRDKFLLSKEYGLDGYLSTRIRHGTFLNHIRSVFESHNILSQQDKDGKYLDNEYWNGLGYSNTDKLGLIQDAIKVFSHKVDFYTDSLVKDFLQVRTEKHQKNPNGWFNYGLTSQELGYLFTIARDKIKDSITFVNFIFEFLEEKTEIILEDIRKLLLTEVKGQYDNFLSSLFEELDHIFERNINSDLKNSITLCGTALQQELSNITEWFHLSNTSKDIVLDLRVLIQTAVQITNTIYPTFTIKPSIVQNEKVPLAGTVHLIYVFRILFDNIIKHSRLQSENLEIEVQTETVGSDLKLSFKNNLSADIDLQQLEAKLKNVKDKWQNNVRDFDKVDVEGDSGFDKIRRIIVFDLEIKQYSFDYIIQDGYVEITVSLNIPKISKYDEDENITD